MTSVFIRVTCVLNHLANNKTNASLDVALDLGYYFFAGWQDSEYNHVLRFTDYDSYASFLTLLVRPSRGSPN
jgi:hypothetical protein